MIEMTFATSVYLIGNTPMLRQGVSSYFQNQGWEIASFDCIQSFLDARCDGWAGCVILDMDAACNHGSELQCRLREQGWEIPVIYLSSHEDTAAVVRAVRRGAYDYLIKPVDMMLLLGRVRDAVELSVAQAEMVRRKKVLVSRMALLTERERNILTLALSGKSNKEVSQVLGISHRTVEAHRSHILVKLEIGNLLELAHTFIDAERRLFSSGKPGPAFACA